jgi:uncharacterized protein YwlG (UPF0340 family)
MTKINYLEKENKNMKSELKKEKFPKGGIVYVIDYSNNEKEVYRIGKTDGMNKRKKIYNTHSLYKKKVKLYYETSCPIQIETCLRALLYKYRYKNRKDFYICDIKVMNRALNNCKKSVKCMNQIGGFEFDNRINILRYRKKRLQKARNKMQTYIKYI